MQKESVQDAADTSWDIIKSFDKEKVKESNEDQKISEWYLTYWMIIFGGAILGAILHYALLFLAVSVPLNVSSLVELIFVILVYISRYIPELVLLWIRYKKYGTIRPVLRFLKQKWREKLTQIAFVCAVVSAIHGILLPLAVRRADQSEMDSALRQFGIQAGGWLSEAAGDITTQRAAETINSISESNYVTIFHTAVLGHAYLRYLKGMGEMKGSFGGSLQNEINTVQKDVILFDLSLAAYFILAVYVLRSYSKKKKSCGYALLFPLAGIVVFGSNIILNASGYL